MAGLTQVLCVAGEIITPGVWWRKGAACIREILPEPIRK